MKRAMQFVVFSSAVVLALGGKLRRPRPRGAEQPERRQDEWQAVSRRRSSDPGRPSRFRCNFPTAAARLSPAPTSR